MISIVDQTHHFQKIPKLVHVNAPGSLLKRAGFEIMDLFRLPEIDGQTLHEDLIFARPAK